jgi:UDP-N-acetylglucosamine transferase subunit ALG13
MILVTTGANGAPFDRLLSVVDRFEVGEEVVVQHGPSQLRPAGATWLDYVPFDELTELVSRARVVVSHAGVGSILLCLSQGHSPVVVPRLASHGEAVDDHQLGFARRLAAAGSVTCVEDVHEIPVIVRSQRDRRTAVGSSATSRLAADLNLYLDSVLS